MPKEIVTQKSDQCLECDAKMSLRVCLTCGHVGCCDSSPGQHAREHAKSTEHQVMASYPVNEHSFTWCYADDNYLEE